MGRRYSHSLRVTRYHTLRKEKGSCSLLFWEEIYLRSEDRPTELLEADPYGVTDEDSEVAVVFCMLMAVSSLTLR